MVLKRKSLNPKAKRPLYPRNIPQIASIIRQQLNRSGDCIFLYDSAGELVVDSNGQAICVQEGVIVTRNFTTLKSSGSQRFNIPQVLSGTSITMDVYPTNGNAGLPLGAPAVTNNVYQTITFTLTGNMDYIGFDGVDYFDGIPANVLVDGRIYKIDEDWTGPSTVLVDSSGNNQDGTAVNITSADKEEFTQSNGDWFGAELVTNGGFDNGITDWLAGRSSILSNVSGKLRVDNTIASGYGYQSNAVGVGVFQAKVEAYAGTINTDVRIGSGPEAAGYGRFNAAGNQIIETNITSTSANVVFSLFANGGGLGDYAEFDNVSLKRLLEVV